MSRPRRITVEEAEVDRMLLEMTYGRYRVVRFTDVQPSDEDPDQEIGTTAYWIVKTREEAEQMAELWSQDLQEGDAIEVWEDQLDGPYHVLLVWSRPTGAQPIKTIIPPDTYDL